MKGRRLHLGPARDKFPLIRVQAGGDVNEGRDCRFAVRDFNCRQRLRREIKTYLSVALAEGRCQGAYAVLYFGSVFKSNKLSGLDHRGRNRLGQRHSGVYSSRRPN